MKQQAAVTGTGQVGYEGQLDQPYSELTGEAADRALDDAGLTMDDIDAVVIGHAPGGFIGMNHPERWAVDHIGAVDKPQMRIHTGGSTGGSAAEAAFYHVASGRYDNVLVVGGEKIQESEQPQRVLNSIWDPLYEKIFGLNTINLAAFNAREIMHEYDITRETLAKVAVKNWTNAKNNPHAHLSGEPTVEEVLESRMLCYPLSLYDTCPASAGGSALVVSGEDAVRDSQTTAWISGIGMNLDTYFIGDRVASTGEGLGAHLETATNRAYEMAGIDDPAEELDVAELYSPFSHRTLTNAAAANLTENPQTAARDLEAGEFEIDGSIPLDPSGGVHCSNPIGITAMIRVIEIADQIRGEAGAHQVPDASVGLATGSGGATQFYTAMILDAAKP